MVVIRCSKLKTNAQLPRAAHEGDAGLDLFAAEDCMIPVGQWRRVGTGIAMELPVGMEGQVRPRSGLAWRHGVTVLNAPGTVDCGYRGEVMVILINHGNRDFKVSSGMRIAQLVIAEVAQARVEWAESLNDSHRGDNGFGSTGVEDFSGAPKKLSE
ncbi:MAG TPA: dUTP diphosphatase [Candidatus Aminicenantes bacterium]|nr:dUTP diphosphatase [Candidatus Aminicenantes bacterium]